MTREIEIKITYELEDPRDVETSIGLFILSERPDSGETPWKETHRSRIHFDANYDKYYCTVTYERTR